MIDKTITKLKTNSEQQFKNLIFLFTFDGVIFCFGDGRPFGLWAAIVRPKCIHSFPFIVIVLTRAQQTAWDCHLFFKIPIFHCTLLISLRRIVVFFVGDLIICSSFPSEI